MESLNRMTVIVKDNGFGIKNIIINEPKTYNSLSFKTLNILINMVCKKKVIINNMGFFVVSNEIKNYTGITPKNKEQQFSLI